MIRLAGIISQNSFVPPDQIPQELRSVNTKTIKIAELVSHVAEENPDNPDVVDDHEGQMAKAQLLSLHKQAGELYNMLGDNEELEGWVQSKLTKAADYINAVYNNMQYEKNKPATIGNGMGATADKEPSPMNEAKSPWEQPGDTKVKTVKISEKAPAGWEKTVKAMKKHKEIDNPFALAQYMKKKGYTPHKEENEELKTEVIPHSQMQKYRGKGKPDTAAYPDAGPIVKQLQAQGAKGTGGVWKDSSGKYLGRVIHGKWHAAEEEEKAAQGALALPDDPYAPGPQQPKQQGISTKTVGSVPSPQFRQIEDPYGLDED